MTGSPASARPLAFLAATNFNRIMPLRMVVRRLFDFLRGIDMLIRSLTFIRAFGLGPLTGVLAIAFTRENTLSAILLTLLVVVMDIGSGWLRRRLISLNPDRRQATAEAATTAAKARAL